MEIYYDRAHSRLVYIGESASPDFWDSHWETEKLRESIKRGKDDRITLETLRKYIPNKKGRILEGGCGRGQIVYCMHVHGYESMGVDFATETIKKVKAAIPELNVRVGDVRNLPFPDDYFTGYWSLGVIEHFWDGYYDILKEMQRVLNNGGYVFLTFPYMSSLRRLKAKLGLYRDMGELGREEVERFYSFAFDEQTVINDFTASGFKLLEKKPINGLKGFKDEVSPFKPLLQRLTNYKGNHLSVRGLSYILDKALAIFAGHMMFLAFKNIK